MPIAHNLYYVFVLDHEEVRPAQMLIAEHAVRSIYKAGDRYWRFYSRLTLDKLKALLEPKFPTIAAGLRQSDKKQPPRPKNERPEPGKIKENIYTQGDKYKVMVAKRGSTFYAVADTLEKAEEIMAKVKQFMMGLQGVSESPAETPAGVPA